MLSCTAEYLHVEGAPCVGRATRISSVPAGRLLRCPQLPMADRLWSTALRIPRQQQRRRLTPSSSSVPPWPWAISSKWWHRRQQRQQSHHCPPRPMSLPQAETLRCHYDQARQRPPVVQHHFCQRARLHQGWRWRCRRCRHLHQSRGCRLLRFLPREASWSHAGRSRTPFGWEDEPSGEAGCSCGGWCRPPQTW